MRQARSEGGFTLVEVMMAVAIGATLAALALPSLAALGGASDDAGTLLAADLREARRQAVMRGRPVLLCPLDAAAGCSDAARADWSRGWTVTLATADGEVVLRRELPADPARTIARVDAPTALAFAHDGTLRRGDGALGTARWRVSGRAQSALAVCVTPVGQAISATGDC